MEMVKKMGLALLLTAPLYAADFAIEIGSPVAAPGTVSKVKAAAFSVRTHDCPDPAKVKYTGTAVWEANGQRGSAALLFAEGTTGTASVARSDYKTDARWLAVITAECGGIKAGALISINGLAYDRNSAKFLTHPPTEADIAAALKGEQR